MPRVVAGFGLLLLALLAAACGGSDAPPAPPVLEGTTWKVTAVDGAPIVAGTAPTVAFGTDGTVSGNAGCNGFSGGYTADGATLAVQPLASTRKLCSDPGVMEQEQQLLAGLQASTKVVAGDGGAVTTQDATGAARLTLAPA